MDDLSFASVWDDTTPRSLPPPLPRETFNYTSFGEEPHEEQSDFALVNPADDGDPGDDFGDFGDFGDANVVVGGFDDSDMGGFDDGAFFQGFSHDTVPPDPGPSTWEPLRPETIQNPAELSRRVEELLAPIYRHIDPATVMSQEGIRQVEGIGQILTTPER